MFHIGHYNVITKAKEYCEKLIVGVNTDELVRSYKNKTPIIPTEERIMVVESIRGVDQAVSIDHRDKIKGACPTIKAIWCRYSLFTIYKRGIIYRARKKDWQR